MAQNEPDRSIKLNPHPAVENPTEDLTESTNRSTRDQRDQAIDEVDEASQESFPASDAPAWTHDHA